MLPKIEARWALIEVTVPPGVLKTAVPPVHAALASPPESVQLFAVLLHMPLPPEMTLLLIAPVPSQYCVAYETTRLI